MQVAVPHPMRTPTASRLRRLFAEVLATSATLGTSYGCGGIAASGSLVGTNLDGGGGDGQVTESGFTSVCAHGQLMMSIGDIKVDPSIDYIASRQESWYPQEVDAGAQYPE